MKTLLVINSDGKIIKKIKILIKINNKIVGEVLTTNFGNTSSTIDVAAYEEDLTKVLR